MSKPKRYNFLNKLQIDQNVKLKLSDNLDSIVRGNDEVFVTPLGSKIGADKVLSDWDKIYSKGVNRLNSDLIDLEKSNRSKYGPRSISKPWSERRQALREYFETPHIKEEKIMLLGKAVPPKNSLRASDLSEAIKFSKNSTNSGLPFYTKKGSVKDLYLRDFDKLYSMKLPCVLFTRTQESGKTRDVWGYPFADTLKENMLYLPILKYQRKLNWRSSLVSPFQVQKRLTEVINTSMRSKDMVCVSIDFSSYDRTISPSLQRAVCDLYYKRIFQTKYHKFIEEVCDRKINIGIVTPEGIWSGPHGEPSGASTTNEDDSIVQYLISQSSGLIDGLPFDIQGDDGVYCVPKENVDSFLSHFESYGLKVNKDKSYTKRDFCVYLQNLYHDDYRNASGEVLGIYPVYRALGRLVFQERWFEFEDYGIPGSEYYGIRALTILENCRNHPLFKEFVQYIWSIDKYKLRFSDKSLSLYVELIEATEGTSGLFKNQFGEMIKGIKSFESYKVVQSLNKA